MQEEAPDSPRRLFFFGPVAELRGLKDCPIRPITVQNLLEKPRISSSNSYCVLYKGYYLRCRCARSDNVYRVRSACLEIERGLRGVLYVLGNLVRCKLRAALLPHCRLLSLYEAQPPATSITPTSYLFPYPTFVVCTASSPYIWRWRLCRWRAA